MYTRYSIHVLHLSILIDHVKWRYKIKELIVDLYSCVYTNVYKLVPAQCIQVKLIELCHFESLHVWQANPQKLMKYM